MFADEPIIENHDVLETDNSVFKPDELPERQDELDKLNKIIRPLRSGGTPHNALIYGPTGQGKTVAVENKMDQLQEWAGENERDVAIINVRCKGCQSSYGVIQLLVKNLREYRTGQKEEEPKGYQQKALVQMVFDELDEIGGTIILILDEIDGIGEDDYILYELSRPDVENAKIGLIGITNDAQFRKNLDADVQSSLGKREIYFKPYNATQLQNILARRAAGALKDTEFDGEDRTLDNLSSSVLDEGCIPLTAARAGQETGDARQAIRLFEQACELAEDEEGFVTQDHVREAHKILEREQIREQIDSEVPQRKLTLLSIIKHEIQGNDTPRTKEIYPTYCALAEQEDFRELTQRAVRDKLNDLAHANIITKETRGRGDRKGVANYYSLAIDAELAIEVLKEDPRYEDLVETLTANSKLSSFN